MTANTVIRNHTFYDNVTTTEELNTCVMPVSIDGAEMLLEFVCDGTFSVEVLGKMRNDGQFHQYPYLKLTYTYEEGTQYITDASCFYQVNLTKLSDLKIKITNLTGTFSCYGKVVG